MAAMNTDDKKRFVYRPSKKESEARFIRVNNSGSIVSQPSTLPTARVRPAISRSADAITSHTEPVTPARRVVLVRNSKNRQVGQEPVDFSDVERPNSLGVIPVINSGRKPVFLIRRRIARPEQVKPVEHNQTFEKSSLYNSLDDIRTPSPEYNVVSPDSSGSPSADNVQRYVPYLRHSKSKSRTPSPVRKHSTRRSLSPNYMRSRPPIWQSPSPSPPLKHQSPSPSPPRKQKPSKNADRKRNLATFYSLTNVTEPVTSSSSVITENEKQPRQYPRTSTVKNIQRKKSDNSIVLVNPDDQSIAVIKNPYANGEPLRSTLKHSKSSKKTHFQDEINDSPTEHLVETSRWQRCLGCLARYKRLVIIICLIIILIGVAGLAVSVYFLAKSV